VDNAITTTTSPENTVLHIRPTGRLWSLDLREIWDARETLYILVWRDIKVRYRQSALGVTWAVLQPLLTMLVFSVFLGLLARVPSDGVPYPLFVYCALVPWTFFAYAFSQAGNSLVENQPLLTKVYLPRLLIPLAAIVAGLLDFALAFLVLLGMLIVYGEAPTGHIVFLPLYALLALAASSAAGIWLEALNVKYRDVRYTILFLTQLWFYCSPIVYPSSLVPDDLRWLYGLNPMAGVIDGFRQAMLGTGGATSTILVSAAVTLLALVGAVLYFRRTERTFADKV